MRFIATVGLALVVAACSATPSNTAVSVSWEPIPSPVAEPYPGTGSAEAPQPMALGEPLDIDGFLYEVVEARRWDRGSGDDGWCLAVLVHDETPDPDAPEPLAGWELRDETGRDYAFDFGCQDGTGMPDRPEELAADALEPGMAEGHRYWISFDVLDESAHVWLVRAEEVDGDPVVAIQLQ